MIKNKYIDSIFEGSNHVIKQITGSGVTKGEVKKDIHEFSGNDINVIIGIHGNIDGHVTFTMDEALAFRIASLILGQDVGNFIDEISTSCLEELGNMIMGHTAGLLSQIGIMIDITPPAIVTGDNISIRNDKLDKFCIPVVFDDGSVLGINSALS